MPERLRLLAAAGPQNDITNELREMANYLDRYLRELDTGLLTLIDHTPASFYTEQLTPFIRRSE